MRCIKCGYEICQSAVCCPGCGYEIKPVSKSSSAENLWKWRLIGLFAPPFGIILFFSMRGENPAAAKAALSGAFTGIMLFRISQIIR